MESAKLTVQLSRLLDDRKSLNFDQRMFFYKTHFCRPAPLQSIAEITASVKLKITDYRSASVRDHRLRDRKPGRVWRLCRQDRSKGHGLVRHGLPGFARPRHAVRQNLLARKEPGAPPAGGDSGNNPADCRIEPQGLHQPRFSNQHRAGDVVERNFADPGVFDLLRLCSSRRRTASS